MTDETKMPAAFIGHGSPYSPIDVADIPLMVGLLFMGSLFACLIAFCYSVYMLRLRPPHPVLAVPKPTFDFVIFDSIVIGVFVGISLVAAQALHLQKAYWVPVSCLAVIQGSSLRAVWTKQLHRALGTSVGLLLGIPSDQISGGFRLARNHRVRPLKNVMPEGTNQALIDCRRLDTVASQHVYPTYLRSPS